MKYKQIKENEEIGALIAKGDENLAVLGFTDHSVAHATLVAERAGEILEAFGYKKKQIELARIAGFVHDIGNSINRSRHAEYGAILANELLKSMDIELNDRLTIVSAIGHHDESTGGATDIVSAAVIIADKTDVRRNRVRNKNKAAFDKHDTVNYAVEHAKLTIDKEKKSIVFAIELDENICSVMDYFEIFLDRMLMCRKAAEQFGMKFKMTANGSKVC